MPARRSVGYELGDRLRERVLLGRREAFALADDAAAAIDPDAERRRAPRVELHGHARVDVGDHVVRDAEAPRGRAGAHYARLRVHADRDDAQAARAVALVERLIER